MNRVIGFSSSEFRGQLPKPSTRENHFNDANKEEIDRYVSYPPKNSNFFFLN
jgi:hypothetical protein